MYVRHVESPARGPNPALGQILSGPQPSHEIYNARILLFGYCWGDESDGLLF